MKTNRCLFCGRILNNTDETQFSWHSNCIKKFFGSALFPNSALLEKDLEYLAVEELKNNTSLSGVQRKLSVGISKDKTLRRLQTVLQNCRANTASNATTCCSPLSLYCRNGVRLVVNIR